MKWFKKLRARLKAPRKKASHVAAQSVSAGTYEPTFIPLAAISAVVLPQFVARESVSHLGIQGYAPVIRISQNRRYCEFCGERVCANIRHICWGNAEHHMTTLTVEERARVLTQLASKPRKLTRSQLRKLYSADRLGLAMIEGERYGD